MDFVFTLCLRVFVVQISGVSQRAQSRFGYFFASFAFFAFFAILPSPLFPVGVYF